MSASIYGAPGATTNLGRGYKARSIQQFTPEQMNLFRSLFSQVGPESSLARLAGGEEGMFEQLEAPALKQFAGLQGSLASRFSGMGLGGRRSSGFQNTANAAASDFAQQLQAQRMGLQRQALNDLMGFSSSLLQQRPYEQFITERKPSFMQSLLGAFGSGLGQFAGGLGGGLGARAGSALGGLF